MRKTCWVGLTVFLATGAASFVFSMGTGHAQIPDPLPDASSAPVEPSGTTLPTTTAAPTVTVAPKPTAVMIKPFEPEPTEPTEDKPTKTAASDHDQVVGRFGIGYFGQYDVPIGFTGARRAGGIEPAQFVGVRYWWKRVRLDISFGINLQSGTQQVADKSSDQASTLVLAGRIAVPIALFVGSHYTFFIGPELGYGHAGETIPGAETTPSPGVTTKFPDTTHEGSRLSFGARAGAEVHFGFIGIPHLALDATVGFFLERTTGKTNAPPSSTIPPGPGTDPFTTIEATFTHTGFQSTISHQPWNIFISNVAAVYYF